MAADGERALSDAAPNERLEATVHGRVQGVGFRYFILGIASDLGLSGWVANELDGTVRVVAEGSRPALEQLLAELREGPRGARVERVASSWLPASGGFARFGVRSAGHRGD